jgi:hypothetical protein
MAGRWLKRAGLVAALGVALTACGRGEQTEHAELAALKARVEALNRQAQEGADIEALSRLQRA